ncbi:hypothetical protein DDZ13_06515 [Coraliomargarita sinensis]|uniref:Uncharacterized protein n=1 Tax=Coraliomargarita sinensis TaxID=2174842 RepID=A0A317ZKR9_9BACT|nr:hypothetical protein DDZ13_06515 [Coraliomargarita sinensis]
MIVNRGDDAVLVEASPFGAGDTEVEDLAESFADPRPGGDALDFSTAECLDDGAVVRLPIGAVFRFALGEKLPANVGHFDHFCHVWSPFIWFYLAYSALPAFKDNILDTNTPKP